MTVSISTTYCINGIGGSKFAAQAMVCLEAMALSTNGNAKACWCSVNANQRFGWNWNFFKFYISVCYKNKKQNQSHKSKPECISTDGACFFIGSIRAMGKVPETLAMMGYL